MSHKKMQEQFNPKKGVAQGGLSIMSGCVTRDELAGRALAFALDLAESLHDGRRPTPAEIKLIADMLRTLPHQPQRRAVVVEGNHHDRRPTLGGCDGDDDEKKKKAKKKKKKDKKSKKDETDSKGKGKKSEKKEKKEKKKRKSKERNGGGEASEESGSGASGGGGSTIDSGRSVEVLGGRLEYTQETKGENETATSLITVDTLKLRDLVHAHLKQPLSSLSPSPDRSPRHDGQKVPPLPHSFSFLFHFFLAHTVQGNVMLR